MRAFIVVAMVAIRTNNMYAVQLPFVKYVSVMSVVAEENGRQGGWTYN